jgi:hypothetical protein
MTRAEQILVNNAASAASYNQNVAIQVLYRVWKNAFPNCDNCPFYIKCKAMFDNGTVMFCHDAVEYFFMEMGRESGEEKS